MLTIEVRVNGSVVTVIDAINVGDNRTRISAKDTVYRYRGTRFPIDHNWPPVTFSGTTTHDRDDGIEALAQELCRCAVMGGAA